MNKKIITLFIAIIIFSLAAIGYMIWNTRNANKTEEKNAPEKTTEETATGTLENAEKEIARVIVEGQNNVEAKPLSEEDKTKNELSHIAAAFSERFGSYSNQSNYSNMSDLKIFMTPKMQEWADSYVADQRSKNLSRENYYGITTTAVTQEIKEFDNDGGKAIIIVQTRRKEFLGTTDNATNTFYQNITINFVKDQKTWKVDDATWQD